MIRRVKDVVDAYSFILENHYKVQNFSTLEIGTRKSMSIKDFVLLVSNHLNQLVISSPELNFGKKEERKGEYKDAKANIDPMKSIGWSSACNVESSLSDLMSLELQELH